MYASWESSSLARHEIRLQTQHLVEPVSLVSVDAYQALMAAQSAVEATGRPGTPPEARGSIPPNISGDRITGFNNLNRFTYANANTNVPRQWRNKLGYVTFVQFMLDHGRDAQPVTGTNVPLSTNSPDCPLHTETVRGRSFSFPPREQPSHAARRALIAAIEIVRERNSTISNTNQRNWVSVVTFDTQGGTRLAQSLTGDYSAAQNTCARLQAAGDVGPTTNTESGLIMGRTHLETVGRANANKVVVLLTDGSPNLWETPDSAITQYMSQNASTNYYGSGAHWLDAPLMQAHQLEAKRWELYPVGVGLGTDYGFMDCFARMGGTADDNGQSPRGSGNPAEYEQRLTTIFEKIINSGRMRLVQ